MTVAIDSETAACLRTLRGARLLRVLAERYPNPPSYHRVQLHTERSVITVTLRSESVSENLEVCCISARPGEVTSAFDERDEIRPADFRIDQVLVLRRAEWLEPGEPSSVGIGKNPQQHIIGVPDDVRPWFEHTLVDAGLALVDERGSGLSLEADTFPLVLQCRYTVSSSALPRGDAWPIE